MKRILFSRLVNLALLLIATGSLGFFVGKKHAPQTSICTNVASGLPNKNQVLLELDLGKKCLAEQADTTQGHLKMMMDDIDGMVSVINNSTNLIADWYIIEGMALVSFRNLDDIYHGDVLKVYNCLHPINDALVGHHIW
jgi:hypothetical protein